MLVVGHRYSLFSVVGAGVCCALPLIGLLAVKAASPLPIVSARSSAEHAHDLSWDLMAGTRIERVMVTTAEGRVRGLGITRAGPAFARAGLHAGDVVMRVNGMDLSAGDLPGLRLYAQLKDRPVITLDILRDGRPATIDFDINDSASLENH